MLIYLELMDDQRDRDKFTQLYNLYRQQMYSVAYERLQNEQDAEDAVHQAFLEIIDHMDKVRQADSPETKGLMFGLLIMRCVVIDRLIKLILQLMDYRLFQNKM